MNAAVALHVDDQPSLDLLVRALAARAWARSYLWSEGLIEDLHDVADPLQEWAVHRGIVAAIGQNAVQGILSDALREFRRW